MNDTRIQILIDLAVREETARREDACESSLTDPKGRGVRIDVYDWETRYYLDPAVPWGEIHEHHLAGDPDSAS